MRELIERYEDPRITEILSDVAKHRRWLRIEIEVMREQVNRGIIPWNQPIIFDRFVEHAYHHWSDRHTHATAQIEQLVRHDVVAFLRYTANEWFGEDDYRKTPLHLGLTSSDLVDTGWAMAWVEIGGLLREALQGLHNRLAEMRQDHENVWVEGRTHGEVAAPTTWQHRIQTWIALVARADQDLRDSLRRNPGKLSGPVGMYSDWVPREIETAVLGRLGVGTGYISTQIVARDFQLDKAQAMLRAIQAVEQIATDLRIAVLIGQATLDRPDGTVGSSSMPGKVNPVELEQLCGLARVARGHVNSLSESVPSWLERDITASSVDRIAMADLVHLTAYSVAKMTRLLSQEVKLVGVSNRGLLNSDSFAFEKACRAQAETLWLNPNRQE